MAGEVWRVPRSVVTLGGPETIMPLSRGQRNTPKVKIVLGLAADFSGLIRCPARGVDFAGAKRSAVLLSDSPPSVSLELNGGRSRARTANLLLVRPERNVILVQC